MIRTKFNLLLACICLSLCSCKSDLEKKQDACRLTIIAFCNKSEECTGELKEACILAAQENKICDQKIHSSVEEIRQCELDLATATCEQPPISCVILE